MADQNNGAVEHFDCLVYRDGALTPEPRQLVREEPLAITLDGRPLITLMRTPGHERELALGFLITDGLISSAKDVGLIHFCASGDEDSAGQLRVQLVPGAKLLREPDAHRKVYSSCSLCGAEAIEEVAAGLSPFVPSEIPAARICELGRRLRAEQPVFDLTGGTHAAALTDLGVEAARAPLFVREDLGRHNALDKVVGAAAIRNVQFERPLLFLSGRLSFEMIAKAARAGIGTVAGVSAPTALSIALARRLNMFVAGFVRGESFTVYSGDLTA